MTEKLELDSLSKDDIETILDALDEWESKDIEFLELIETLKKVPDPDKATQPEVYEVFCEFKQRMLSQERRARDNKRQRRTKSIMLKAKLILVMQRVATDQLFKDAQG